MPALPATSASHPPGPEFFAYEGIGAGWAIVDMTITNASTYGSTMKVEPRPRALHMEASMFSDGGGMSVVSCGSTSEQKVILEDAPMGLNISAGTFSGRCYPGSGSITFDGSCRDPACLTFSRRVVVMGTGDVARWSLRLRSDSGSATLVATGANAASFVAEDFGNGTRIVLPEIVYIRNGTITVPNDGILVGAALRFHDNSFFGDASLIMETATTTRTCECQFTHLTGDLVERDPTYTFRLDTGRVSGGSDEIVIVAGLPPVD